MKGASDVWKYYSCSVTKEKDTRLDCIMNDMYQSGGRKLQRSQECEAWLSFSSPNLGGC